MVQRRTKIRAGVGVLGAATVAAGALLFGQMSAKPFDVSVSVGIWSWEAPGTVGAEQVRQQATDLKKEAISRVYIDITSYVDAMELPADKNPQAAIADFTSKLKETARAYNAGGVRPYALAGNSKWGSPDAEYLPLAIVDYLKDYNAQAAPEEELHGLQFDIEPYSEEGFYDDATTGFSDYLAVTKAIIARHASNFSAKDIDLGFAVPFWFDGENPDVPQVAMSGTTKYPVFHLIDQLKTLPSGYLAVMAYRTQAGGEDGSIAHTKAEMDYASKTQTVKVYIGQETAQVEPASITFYSLGKNKLKAAVKELDTAFKGQPAYGGILVHDSKSFRELKA